jgi:uncharacterized membrane protein
VTEFTTSVRIRRPIGEVFAFASDPLNLPQWNSAVQAVRRTGGPGDGVGSTYALERELPIGRVENQLELFAREHPTEFGIRTTSGPTPFSYRYGLSAANGETVVQLDAALELDGAAALLGPLLGRAVKRGVDDNLAELKRLLETSTPATRPGEPPGRTPTTRRGGVGKKPRCGGAFSLHAAGSDRR